MSLQPRNQHQPNSGPCQLPSRHFFKMRTGTSGLETSRPYATLQSYLIPPARWSASARKFAWFCLFHPTPQILKTGFSGLLSRSRSTRAKHSKKLPLMVSIGKEFEGDCRPSACRPMPVLDLRIGINAKFFEDVQAGRDAFPFAKILKGAQWSSSRSRPQGRSSA